MAIQKKQIAQGAKGDPARNFIIGALVVAAFFGAYRFASASNAGAATQTGAPASLAAGAGASAGAATGGSGGASTGQGVATLQGGVQKISVDASQGYNPSVIQLKAGLPSEITFSQSSGCTAIVQSSQLRFQEDLSAGPKTVKLAALQPGTYGFACGMGMVQGQIVVQ